MGRGWGGDQIKLQKNREFGERTNDELKTNTFFLYQNESFSEGIYILCAKGNPYLQRDKYDSQRYP